MAPTRMHPRTEGERDRDNTIYTLTSVGRRDEGTKFLGQEEGGSDKWMAAPDKKTD